MEFVYYPLAVRKEKERQIIPGAAVLAAPRGSHRHRHADLLAVLLSISGDHRYEIEEIQELSATAGNVFFGAQGSVTRAMQQASEETNRRMLERNLDRGYEGVRAGGSINLAALHNGWLFVCQFGSTGAMLISSDKFEEFGKSEGLAENLGQSKHILPRFYQSEVKDGDLILMNSRPPSTWSSYYLAGSASLEMDQVKRRLLNQVTSDIEAVAIKVREGNPRVEIGDWRGEIEMSAEEGSSVEVPASEAGERKFAHPAPPENIQEEKTDISVNEKSQDLTDEDTSPNGTSAPGQLDQDSIPVVPGQVEQDIFSGEGGKGSSDSGRPPNPYMIKAARAWMNARTMNSKLRLGVDRLRKKISPKSRPLQETATSAIWVFLAVLLPVALVLLSAAAYTRIGKAEQYDTYMRQAQEAADLARVEKSTVQQHVYWAQTLDLVRSAEKYDVTQESRMLYEQAQFLLDDMDLAARLDFRPALTQFFPAGMGITHIHASSSGVYLLDSTSGSILRIFLNTKGFYEIDDEFKCLPGPYGLEMVTDLVDFINLPANVDNYRIMAVDSVGNLLYCRPGEVPVSRTLAAPESGWGRIAGVGYDGDVLYVMDVEKDAIWMYAGKDPNQPNAAAATGIVFSESPVKFLDEDVPELSGALDLVINQQDTYILHQDGHVTHCRYSHDKALRLTECQDPSPYTDNRVGREDKKPWIFMDAVFTMLQTTRLPDASIYILDTVNPSIYQFSYQLNLERVLRPQYNRSYPLPDTPPSGFGVSPDLELFLAFSNKLFVAPLK